MALHGDKTQRQRDLAMDSKQHHYYMVKGEMDVIVYVGFKRGRSRILLATDVAARGLG